MDYSAYLTPPYLSPEGLPREPRTPVSAPSTIRPRESRWHPYEHRARSLTPTSGLRSSKSTENVSTTSRKAWPQPSSKSRYPYAAYDSTQNCTPPSDRPSVSSKLYITPDPSPHPVRYSHKQSYPVPPTIEQSISSNNSFRSALPPTPPRTRSRASVESDGSTPPLCSIDAPHARRIFVQQLYDTLMSIYYFTPPSSSQKVLLPVPGSLPIDPATLHWFTTELVRRASVPSAVLKLAASYMNRARSAAIRSCEAKVPAPISPPPSPHYPASPASYFPSYSVPHRTNAGPELADPRQMLLGALVLAQKFLIDAAYTSATWGKLSGLPASDVAAVERALGTALDWRLWEKNL